MYQWRYIHSKILVLVLVVWVSGTRTCGPQNESAPAQLAARLRLPEERRRDIPLVLRHVEETLSTRWPGIRAALFGSASTGLAQRNSDVDMYLHLPEDSEAPRDLIQVQRVLAQHSSLFTNYTFTDASVPIITFRHIPSGFYVDLNIKTFEGVKNSELIRYLVGSGCKRDLALLLRQWAMLNGISGRGMFPSYGIALLVVFYLQQKNILPPVSELQKNAKPFFVDDWNMGYNEVPLQSRINESLYELLGGFFEFYEGFDFDENIVSTFVAHPVKRQLFEDLRTVPNVFSLYVQNVESNTTMPLNVGSSVCIQDPFQHNKNVGKTRLNRTSSQFWTEVKRAALKYRENDENAFLKDIFNYEQTYKLV